MRGVTKGQSRGGAGGKKAPLVLVWHGSEAPLGRGEGKRALALPSPLPLVGTVLGT